ncbi:MAG: ATP-dependent DNA ligase [Deltaproteobacteria bacterium]|nr:ATP-dependent DNA ligase [Deltaproteobacteria bacterium]
MPMYTTENAKPLGKGLHAPAGSITDPDLARLLQTYRRNVAGGYRSLLPEEIAERLPDGPMHASPKIDGELWFMVFDGGEAWLSNSSGRLIIGGVPLLEEARSFAGRARDRTVVAGELFGTREQGRCRVGDVSHAMSGGAKAEVDQLGFAAFDLLWGGDEQASMPIDAYEDKYKTIERLFEGGERCKPVHTVKTSSSAEVRDLFGEWVESGAYEGVVTRADGRISKIKPSFHVDAVIIGYTEREEDPEQIRSLALALMRPDGALQYVINCGNMSDDQRRELKKMLAGSEVRSNWRLSSSDGAMFRFVKPQIVIEIKVTDVQSEDSSGKPILRMVLEYSDEGGLQAVRKLPCASMLFPVFVRVRDDKQVKAEDIRLAQVQERTEVADTEVKASRVELPASEIVERRVYTKTTKGQMAVRKLVMWKTGKETLDDRYPAFVVHFTDYSPGRKEPLKREVRLAPDRETAGAIAEAMIEENIKRGWKEA